VEAMRFLNENLFRTPAFLLDPSVTRRIEANGSLDRINDAQTHILHTLLSDDVAGRMVEQAALARGAPTYTFPEMLADLQHGIWSELGDSRVTIDAFRRALQRSYLDQLDAKLNPRSGGSSSVIIIGSRMSSSSPAGGVADARAAMRAELVALRAQLDAAVPKAADATTRAHLLDARVQVERILDPNR